MKKILAAVLAAMMLTSCAVTKNVATVGNIKITKGEFEFYLSSIKSQMNGTELNTDEDWETQEIEGKKAIEVAKDRALDIAIKNAEYVELAQLMGLALTDEEQATVKSTKARFVSSYGGDTQYKQYLKENNLSDKFIDMMCKSTMYLNKLKKKVSDESQITDEACQKFFEDNRDEFETEYRYAKHILILTKDAATMQPKSAEEQKAAEELVNTLYTRITENGEDFDALMKEYTEDPGLESNPNGYLFGTGEMVPEFEQTTDALEFGEVGMCKSDYGFHIIKRMPIGYDDVKDKVKNKLIEDKLNENLEEWAKQYNLKIVKNEDIIKEVK